MRAYRLPQDPEAFEEVSRIWREVGAEYAVLTDDEIAAAEAAEYADDPADDSVVAEVRRVRWRISARFGHDIERYGDYLAECERRIAHLVEWVNLDDRGRNAEPPG